MAATFKPVNNPPTAEASKEDSMPTSPTTPRPDSAPKPPPPIPSSPTMDDATTPTKATFAGAALASQKPLPTSPFPDGVQIPESSEKKVPQRENSQRSRKSKDSDEMDMDESDGEAGAGDDGVGSDEESVNADGSRSGKKKKSQRFYCVEYPPCNLSFTRSEHLARHIRKHTGERPFQCHCSRRFSRLDNLRQHAQTVHVNEDIPMDSLAATGTRFQRQIRTDRVRTGAGRARASTAGSLGAPARGHSKSLSTSSITSISSVGSNYSTRDEARRRPAPIVMPADPRARFSFESNRSAAESQLSYRAVSPGDFSTPTSATFSTGQSSPRWGSGFASPTSSHSRSQSMYAVGTRTPGRRLSVPSGGNPFQSPHGVSLGRSMFGAAPLNSSNVALLSSPNNGSLLSSPTASTSGWSRRESISRSNEEDLRRRTWHPDSSGSRLSSVLNASQFPTTTAPLPLANPATQQTSLRLPGIESFDPIPHRPVSPPRRIPSPMAIDSDAANPPAFLPGTDSMPEDRRGVAQWDMGLHRGLTRLEINSRTPPRETAGAWASEANQAVQAQAERARVGQPTVRFEAEPQVVQMPPEANPGAGIAMGHQYTMSAPATNTPREMKRHAWYHGPGTGGGETDRASRVERMFHPNLANGFTGFPARVPQTVHEQQPLGPIDRTGSADPMRRLEALVAVATSESSAATAY